MVLPETLVRFSETPTPAERGEALTLAAQEAVQHTGRPLMLGAQRGQSATIELRYVLLSVAGDYATAARNDKIRDLLPTLREDWGQSGLPLVVLSPQNKKRLGYPANFDGIPNVATFSPPRSVFGDRSRQLQQLELGERLPGIVAQAYAISTASPQARPGPVTTRWKPPGTGPTTPGGPGTSGPDPSGPTPTRR